ncbi:MAG: uroporphyrinogen decarboxylase [Ignavibacteria bacterium]|nr:uroporphyrinogen decarboxylase [Ignavibacteria bacterium]
MQKFSNNLFLRACFQQHAERTPIWMMRQAGRYLPEYRAVRAKYDFLTMCKTPELAAEVTMQPVDIVGVDAAIIFSDILVIPEAMGMKLFVNEGSGPKFETAISSESDIDKLIIPEPSDKLKYVLDAVSLTKKILNNRVPLIGFSGSPWTLFAYMVEGNGTKDFVKAKTMLFNEPKLSHKLLEKISSAVSQYLIAKINAGADAIQIFDTWGGMLGYEELREFSLRYVQKIIFDVKEKFGNTIPIIFFSKGSGMWLDDLVKTNCDVVGVDWTMDISVAKYIVGGRTALQGNFDPIMLLSKSEKIISATKTILEKFGSGDGHIFNLGHGILPNTPVENAKLLVETVRQESKKYHHG